MDEDDDDVNINIGNNSTKRYDNIRWIQLLSLTNCSKGKAFITSGLDVKLHVRRINRCVRNATSKSIQSHSNTLNTGSVPSSTAYGAVFDLDAAIYLCQVKCIPYGKLFFL